MDQPIEYITEEAKLRWKFLSERTARFAAELNAANLEKSMFELTISRNYGLTNRDSVDIETGLITRNKE